MVVSGYLMNKRLETRLGSIPYQ